jgi:UDP-N-acetylglucosamine 2-epimerase
MNRRAVSVMARWHFAPTNHAAENLAREGVVERVHVTGNTVVDALQMVIKGAPPLPDDLQSFLDKGPYVLASAHRRESWGEPIEHVARALAAVVDAAPDLRVVFVTHPNPLARGPVDSALAAHPRVRILDALPYPQFLLVMAGAVLAVSDSGGVQEEGPTLGVPVLVTRTITERPEGVSAGAVRLVGTDYDGIVTNALAILLDPAVRTEMSEAARGLYGDGHASERIANVIVGALR